jgi:hypothetical protein
LQLVLANQVIRFFLVQLDQEQTHLNIEIEQSLLFQRLIDDPVLMIQMEVLNNELYGL